MSAFSATPPSSLSDGDTTVLIDPFLTGNPKAAASRRRGRRRPRSCSPMATATMSATPLTIAKRTGAPVVAITELAGELGGRGPGGRQRQPGRHRTRSTGAGPSSCPPGTPRPRPRAPSTRPPGCWSTSRTRSSTTSATPRCSPTCTLVGKRRQVDVALVCIGGHFTMDRHDAVDAAELRRGQDRDPVPLQHVPADRDRRRRRSRPTSSRPRARWSSSWSRARRHTP